MDKKLLLLLFTVLLSSPVFSQCGPGVPTFNVNLTGNPTGTWTSPNIARNGNCCGTLPPNTCIDFVITLDPGAAGISFNIIAGAIPGGALFYQIGCGPPTPLGAPICLSGVGPHILTFCKPGNNANIYQITSIPAAVGGTDVVVNQGCIDTLHATGFNPTSVTWNSVYPGAPGAYNSYLSCTSGCTNPIVTGTNTAPPYVDYVVCGLPQANCMFATVCDTIRVTFNPTLFVSIAPLNPTICFGQTATTITATGTGGTPPYSYLWNNVNPSQSILVGAGNYTVQLTDASGCPPIFSTVTVTTFSVAITANAGPDQTVCNQSPPTTLAGVVTGASGGIWSGGAGTFSPNNTTLNAVYTPTAAELAAGGVNLTLTTTGNGTCPAASDVVHITYVGFTGTVAMTSTPVSCFGGSNGTATATVTGGMSPYTYSWNTVPAQTGATATGIPAGTYTVTIQNAIGCSTTATVTVTQPTILAASTTSTNVSCNGGADGTATVTATGGTPSYTYLWSPGGLTTSAVTGLAAGTYTAAVTDSRGCIFNVTAIVTQPPALTLSVAHTNVSCNAGADGTATATAGGGTPPYTYSWSPSGGSAAAASGLAAGTYSVTVTDSKGCQINGTAIIIQPPPLTATVSVTPETCDYLNNGTATVTANGGTLPYSYSWSPGGMITPSISGLAAGTYAATVTDGKGCTISVFAVITQPAPIAVTMSNTDVSCFGGSNGAVSASTSGGTSPYSYSWSPGGATTATVNAVAAGTYSVTVTDSHGCVQNASVTVNQPLAPLANTSVIVNVSCNGGSDGSIAVTTTGGTTPYAYQWTPGGQTTAAITGQPAGTYSVTVTDANGCVLTSPYSITQPAPLAISFTHTNVSCNAGSNGSATATVTGGTLPYSYSWSPAGGTGSTATGLSAGTYTATVTDGKGCIFSSTVTITEPVVLSVSTSAVNETCNYLNNGTATVTPSGGTIPYTYLWSPGGATTSTVTSLASGTYTVTVTDANGCTASSTAIISEPPPIVITFDSQINVSCFGGSDGALSATPSGGTPNYLYSWSPGGGTGNLISGISAGTYTLTITDNNGCTAQNTATITQPAAPVTVTPSSLPATCHGATNGSLSAAAAGGTGAYTYLWMPGSLVGPTISGVGAGSYTVTATDANGCTGSAVVNVTEPPAMVLTTSTVNSNCGLPTGQASVAVSGGTSPYTYSWSPSGGTAATATNLLAEPYTVTVTDANGCVATQWANVNDNSGPSATIFSIVNVTCFGGSDGSASVGVAGGTGPFTYIWQPAGGTGPVATGLVAGTYTVTVQDANGCESSATTSPDVTQPPPIVTTVSTNPVSCFGGSDGTATATVSGGSPGYTYQWLPGGTSGPSATGLTSGTFTVNVTDTHGCVEATTFAVAQPATAVSVTTSSTPVSCAGGNDGTAAAVATGGTSPYSYSWNPGPLAGPNIGSLAAGTYTVNVTDLNGCTTNAPATVTQPLPLVLATSSNNANCGTASGMAFVSASGGTSPYNYLWNPGGITNDTAGFLLPGTYSVTATDNNGCTTAVTVAVNNNPGPIATITSVTNVSCYGGSDGTATISGSSGAPPYIYSWSPAGGTGATATGLPAGIYIGTITDQNGCIASDTTSPGVTQPTPVTATVATTNVSCFGGSNGSATATAGGGTPGYTFVWLPGGTTGSTVSGLSAGSYTLQTTDTKGCILLTPFVINQPTVVTATISAFSNVSCFGGANGSATVAGAGGTPFYTYNWLPSGGTAPTATGLSAGTYTASVTDTKGCVATTTVNITEPAAAVTATATSTPTSCFGGSNGTATVVANGGSGGYTYLWTPTGATGSTASGLTAGLYSVLVSDINGCQASASTTVTQPTPVTGSLAVTDASCGFSNGVITSMISGGTSPYTYLWSPGGSTTPNITGLAPGNYSVVVTDVAGCTAGFNATVNNIPGPTVNIASVTNVSCNGGSNGSATASITAGTSPFSIVWLPYGGSTLTGTGLTAGSYTVNVTDGLGCQASAVANVTEPTLLTVSASSVTPVSCNGGSDGAITVSGNGGTPVYSYSWSPVLPATPTVTGLSAGTYIATVTDQNGCSNSISINVTQPATLIAAFGTVTNPSCYNSTNGTIGTSVTGGTIPYSYLWSDGQTGSTATGLTAGSYSVTISDANGCSTNLNMVLTQPTQIITNAGGNDTICLGSSGTVTASATGGAGGYYYAWQPSGVINGGIYNVTPTGNTTYTVVAYDAGGCPGTPDSVAAIVYNLTAASIDALAFSPICPGQGTVVYAEAYGDTGPLTYTWNNGLGTGPGGFLVTPSAPITYVVTVTNSCGGSVVDSVSITFNPPPTIVLGSDTNSVCAPGTITFYDSSSTGNVMDPIIGWLWSFGDGNTSTLQNPTHTYNSPGTYQVILTVTTQGGCTNSNTSTPYFVQVHPYPVAAFSQNATELDLPYDMLVLTNQSTGASTYQWSFGDGSTSTAVNPQYLYTTVGIFPIQLIATTPYGCSDTANSSVTTNANVVFPNVFTPNTSGPGGGGYSINSLDNDVFFPYTSGVTDFRFEIFNRWGELIFVSEDINKGWDGYYKGQICQQDVYVWKAYVKLNNGKTFNKSGDVTLLR